MPGQNRGCIPAWARFRCCGLRTGESLLLTTALVGLGLYTALLGEAVRSELQDPGGLCNGDLELGLELGVWLVVDAAVGTAMALVIVVLAFMYLCGSDLARNRQGCLCRVGCMLGTGAAFLFCWSGYGNVIVWEEGNGRFQDCDLLARVLSQVVMYFQMAAVAVVALVVCYALRRPLLLRCCLCPCCSRGSEEQPEVAAGARGASKRAKLLGGGHPADAAMV